MNHFLISSASSWTSSGYFIICQWLEKNQLSISSKKNWLSELWASDYFCRRRAFCITWREGESSMQSQRPWDNGQTLETGKDIYARCQRVKGLFRGTKLWLGFYHFYFSEDQIIQFYHWLSLDSEQTITSLSSSSYFYGKSRNILGSSLLKYIFLVNYIIIYIYFEDLF